MLPDLWCVAILAYYVSHGSGSDSLKLVFSETPTRVVVSKEEPVPIFKIVILYPYNKHVSSSVSCAGRIWKHEVIIDFLIDYIICDCIFD